MSTNPRIIELTEMLFPAICAFFIQREKDGMPKARLIEINTYLKQQQEAGRISGLTFRGISDTYSYQSEYVMTNLVARSILEEDGDHFSLSAYGKKLYKERLARAPLLKTPTNKNDLQ